MDLQSIAIDRSATTLRLKIEKNGNRTHIFNRDKVELLPLSYFPIQFGGKGGIRTLSIRLANKFSKPLELFQQRIRGDKGNRTLN
jgi:hypothetical protein